MGLHWRTCWSSCSKRPHDQSRETWNDVLGFKYAFHIFFQAESFNALKEQGVCLNLLLDCLFFVWFLDLIIYFPGNSTSWLFYKNSERYSRKFILELFGNKDCDSSEVLLIFIHSTTSDVIALHNLTTSGLEPEFL